MLSIPPSQRESLHPCSTSTATAHPASSSTTIRRRICSAFRIDCRISALLGSKTANSRLDYFFRRYPSGISSPGSTGFLLDRSSSFKAHAVRSGVISLRFRTHSSCCMCANFSATATLMNWFSDTPSFSEYNFAVWCTDGMSLNGNFDTADLRASVAILVSFPQNHQKFGWVQHRYAKPLSRRDEVLRVVCD